MLAMLAPLAFAQEAEEIPLASVPEAAMANQPPTVDPTTLYGTVGEPLTGTISAWDADSDPVALTVTDLPPGASFDALSGEILWTPDAAAVGQHRFLIQARDGVHTTEARGIITVEPETWNAVLVPGVGWAVQTIDGGALYQGPIVDLELTSFGQPGTHDGPSHGRVYGDIGLLRALDSDARILTYGLGFDLSLEANATRRIAIPYAGMEFGNVKPIEGAGALFLQPQLGLWLYDDASIGVNATCGWAYALQQIDALSGARCEAAIHWSTW